MNATAIACICQDVFGDSWDLLTRQERAEVVRDVDDLCTEECEDNESDAMYRAARILRQRIGGERNLASYARCLTAGARRAQRAEPLGDSCT